MCKTLTCLTGFLLKVWAFRKIGRQKHFELLQIWIIFVRYRGGLPVFPAQLHVWQITTVFTPKMQNVAAGVSFNLYKTSCVIPFLGPLLWQRWEGSDHAFLQARIQPICPQSCRPKPISLCSKFWHLFSGRPFSVLTFCLLPAELWFSDVSSSFL